MYVCVIFIVEYMYLKTMYVCLESLVWYFIKIKNLKISNIELQCIKLYKCFS